MKVPDKIVVDTNVLSYLFRRSLMGAYYQRQLIGKVGCIACVTPEELHYGAERRQWGDRKRRALHTLIGTYELLPVTLDIAQISGRLRAERARVGRPLSMADAWIAATALGHGLPLLTHDGDFHGIEGLQLVTRLAPVYEDFPRTNATGGDGSVKAAPCSLVCLGSSVLQ